MNACAYLFIFHALELQCHRRENAARARVCACVTFLHVIRRTSMHTVDSCHMKSNFLFVVSVGLLYYRRHRP